MERGSYSAASGGLLQFRKLDIVNHNLANINTPGFKKQVLTGDVQTFDQTLAQLVEGQDPYARGDHVRSPGTVNIKTATDFSPGPIKNTGNVFDVALRNQNDFFVINTAGGPEYTRAGNFTLNSEGQLVTADGFEVAGDGGAITVDGIGASITPDGTVRVNNTNVGRLQVVHVDDTLALERVGAARFKLNAGAAPPRPVEPDVVPGALEMANVSAISSVIDLITANKAFDMYTKSAQTIDTMNNTAITQVGRGR